MWIEYDRIKKLADARRSCERLLWNTAAHRTEQPAHDTHPHSTFGVVSASFCGSGLGLSRLNFRLHFLQRIPAHKFEPLRSRLNRGRFWYVSIHIAGFFEIYKFCMFLFRILFYATFERGTPKRPSIVKCLAVKRQPTMPQHTKRTDVGQI